MLEGLNLMWESGLLEVFAFLFGASIGSFLNVFIHRWPREESVFKPSRSYCPSCKTQIPWYLNIPVFTWLQLRGRCKWCGERISARYIVVEFITGVWFALVVYKFGPSLSSVFVCLSGAALIGASAIDIDKYLLPDIITLGLFPFGVGLAVLSSAGYAPEWPVGWKSALIGAAVGSGVFGALMLGFRVLMKKEGMGLGDVKLMLSLGALVGYNGIPPVIMIASMGGIIVWVALKFSRSVDRNYMVPFGPLLSFGAMAVVVGRDVLIKWHVIIDWSVIFWS